MHTNISIIVAFDNNMSLMVNFMEHLLSCTSLDDKEIILVSDHCKDSDTLGYARKVASEHPEVELYELEHKAGYSKTNNVGVDNSHGDYLLFINTDVFPEPGSIEELERVLKTDGNIGAAQGLLLYPQNYRVQSTGHVYNDYMNHHLFNGRSRDDACVQTEAPRQALTSAFLMMSRSVFEEAGRFNEFYYNAYDGMELTLKIHLLGYECRYVPSAPAFHSTGGSRNYIQHNDEYQGKYFYAHLGDKVVCDLPAYLTKQLEGIERADCYTIVNCTFCMTWEKILDELGIATGDYVAIDDRDSSSVDLFHNTLPDVRASEKPIVFITNHFLDISGNRLWFTGRPQKNDIVIDFFGNGGLVRDLF